MYQRSEARRRWLFQSDRRQSFQPLISWVHFDAYRLEGGYPKNRLDVVFPEDNSSPHDFPHEFDISGSDIDPKRRTVGEFIGALRLGRKPDCFEMTTRNHAIGSAGIYQKKAIPGSFRVGGIANGGSDVNRAHFVRL